MYWIQQQFFFLFTIIYPIVHSHFVSYVLILLGFGAIALVNWRFIKKLPASSGVMKLIKVNLYLLQACLVGFLTWFIFIHFHTFTLIK